MSILIKGMEMPKSCWDCFACHDGWCIINQKIEGHRTVTHSCPLVEVPERMKWIPVTERLPIGGDDSGAICENVCLLMDDGMVSCGWMNGITKKVYYLNARDDVVIKAPITRVTHWMPLPEPPKDGEA